MFKVINHYSKADGIPMATVRVWLGLGAGDMGEPVFKGLLARVEHSDKSTRVSLRMTWASGCGLRRKPVITTTASSTFRS